MQTRPKAKLTQMGVTIDPLDLAKLRTLAEREDRSIGYLIRQAIRQYLATIEREAA